MALKLNSLNLQSHKCSSFALPPMASSSPRSPNFVMASTLRSGTKSAFLSYLFYFFFFFLSLVVVLVSHWYLSRILVDLGLCVFALIRFQAVILCLSDALPGLL